MDSIHHTRLNENSIFFPDGAPELPLPPRVVSGIEEIRLRNRERKWAEQIESPTASPRDKRFTMLSFLRFRLPHGFVTRFCMIGPRKDRDFIDLVYSDKLQKAHYEGAHLCGSVWNCPVCSEIISARRRTELKVLLAQTIYSVCMATFTIEHGREDPLRDLVEREKKAIRSMKSSRPWRRFCEKWGFIGSVWALETTHGNQNGWHPHQHELFILDPGKLPRSAIERKRALERTMRAELFHIFQAALMRHGLTCDSEHGVKVTAHRREYGAYISKWGSCEEVSRSVSKHASGGNKSVWELLADAVSGSEYSWSLFLEYARAFKGKKQLHWSRGLRALLALPEDQKTDEELVTAEEPGQKNRIVVSLPRLAWRYLDYQCLIGALLAFCERVQGNADEVSAFLARMGLRQSVAYGFAPLPLGISSRLASAQAENTASPPGFGPPGGLSGV